MRSFGRGTTVLVGGSRLLGGRVAHKLLAVDQSDITPFFPNKDLRRYCNGPRSTVYLVIVGLHRLVEIGSVEDEGLIGLVYPGAVEGSQLGIGADGELDTCPRISNRGNGIHGKADGISEDWKYKVRKRRHLEYLRDVLSEGTILGERQYNRVSLTIWQLATSDTTSADGELLPKRKTLADTTESRYLPCTVSGFPPDFQIFCGFTAKIIGSGRYSKPMVISALAPSIISWTVLLTPVEPGLAKMQLSVLDEFR